LRNDQREADRISCHRIVLAEDHFGEFFGLSGTEAALSFKYFEAPARLARPSHFHDDHYQLSLTVHGTSENRVGSVVELAGEGSCSIVNPGDPHTSFSAIDQRWAQINLDLPITLIARWQAEAELSDKASRLPLFRPHTEFTNPELRAILGDMLTAYRSGLSPLLIEELNSQLALKFLGLCGTQHREPPVRSEREKVSRAIDYIRAEFREALSLSDLAKASGMSRFHFARVFKSACGLAPYAYVQQVRVNEAIRLLRRRVPLIEVALETGYFDQAHFSNSFKSETGFSPKEYVKHFALPAD
jgi:AraC-like DNA-binding protein